MNLTRSASLLPRVLLIAGVVAGCGPQTASGLTTGESSVKTGSSVSTDPTVAAKARVSPWAPAPPAPGEKVYGAFGLRSLSAPADAHPLITTVQADAVADATDFASRGLLPGTPNVELRLVSDGDFPLRDDGSREPQTLNRRLVWMLTYHGSPPDVKGPPGAAALPPQTCDFVLGVDAISSDIVQSFQTCR